MIKWFHILKRVLKNQKVVVMSIKLRDVYLKHGLMLAPMAGVTDHSFRILCKEAGAEFTVSEMISAKALCYEQLTKKEELVKTAPIAKISEGEFPMAVQIFGSDPEFMARAAEYLEKGNYKGCSSDIKPAAIDINMGCPVHKVVSCGEGSALMKTPERCYDIVKACVNVLENTPVTVKIRAGYTKDSKNAREVALAIEEAGAEMCCVHGRTREEMYQGRADLDIIAEVKDALHIPVVGNGDINSSSDALAMYKKTGCDGVMIGRGATGNPFIFTEILNALEGRENVTVTLRERMDMAIRHLNLMIENKGEYLAGADGKKHAAWYTKNVRGSAALRNSLMMCDTVYDMIKILDDIGNMKDE